MYKHFFNIPNNILYFNASYVSPLPNASFESGIDALRKRHLHFYEMSSIDFFEHPKKLKEIVSRLWRCSFDDVALIPAVSYGIETVIKNLDPKMIGDVLLCEGEFPSNVYPWMAHSKQSKLNLKFISRPADGDWTAALIANISPATKIVCAPLCDWSDGCRFDLNKISDAVKSVGAILVVDASQSFGAVDFDICDFDPDYLLSVGYKWQLGPYALAYMYVAPRNQNGMPLENNWIGRKNSEDFSRLIEYQEDYQSGAARFDMGERSQFQSIPMAIESLGLIEKIGVDQIQNANAVIIDSLFDKLNSKGFILPRREVLLGNIIGPRYQGVDNFGEIVAKLKARDIYVSARGNSLRISPHLYNSLSEVDHLIDELTSVLLNRISN